MQCPDDVQLGAYLDGSAANLDEWESHLDECERCQSAVMKQSDGAEWRHLLPQDSDAAGVDTAIAEGHATTPAIADETASLPAIPGYEIHEILGRGGMGVVYRAHHRRLGRDVAIKVLAGVGRHSPEHWLRFQTEAQAIARLQHPHIIQVFDSGEADGVAFVCQEFATGGNLEQHLQHNAIPPREAAKTIARLAAAVQHAHDHGVLHRDIKPSNLLLSAGEVKLADFGLAKLLDRNETLTQTADVMGTPRYMAPEQATASNNDIGPKTDIYSLGAVLYQMLSGQPPFQGATPLQIMQQVIEAEPTALRQRNPEIHRDLATICHKCLQKDPTRRYESAARLEEDLGRFLRGQPITARPVSSWERGAKWCRRRPAITALIAVSVVAVGTLLGMWAGFTKQLSQQRQIAVEKAEAAEISLFNEREAHSATQEVLEFMTEDVFDAVVPANNNDRDLTVVEVLRVAAEQMEGQFGDRPVVEASMRAAIGNSMSALGQPRNALPHLRRAVALVDSMGAEGRRGLGVTAKLAFLQCLVELGLLEEAKTQVDDLSSPDWTLTPAERLEVLVADADLLLHEDKWEEARESYEKLYPRSLELHGEIHASTDKIRGNLAVIRLKLGAVEEALACFQEQYDSELEVLGADNVRTLATANNVAYTLTILGRHEEAIDVYQDTLDRRRVVLGPEHPETTGSQFNLAMLYVRLEDFVQAVPMFEEILPIQSESLGAAHGQTLFTLQNIAIGHIKLDQPAETVRYMQAHFDPIEDQSSNQPIWAVLYAHYGRAHALLDEVDRAKQLLGKSETIFETLTGLGDDAKAVLVKANAALADAEMRVAVASDGGSAEKTGLSPQQSEEESP